MRAGGATLRGGRQASGTRGRIIVTGVVGAILAVILGIAIATTTGGQAAGNYCLYFGTGTQAGTPGTLAVPQAGASQAVCDQMEISVQQAFVDSASPTGAGTDTFTISGDRPVTLSRAQAAELPAYGAGTNWLIYSGTV